MAGKGQVAVDPRQHGVDAGGLVSLGQSFLVADGQLLGGLAPVQPAQESTGVAQILFYRGGAFLVFAQALFKGLQLVHEIILRIVFCSLSMRVLYDTESVSPIKEAQLQNERVSASGAGV